MTTVITQEMLLDEKNFELRDKYVERYDVFDKVKALALMGDDEIATIEMVTNYYEVLGVRTVQKLIDRNRSELEKDGLKTLKGHEFQLYKLNMMRQGVTLSAKSSLTIIPKRAILRIGMLLTESPIAEEIRTHILSVYENSSTENKIEDIQKQFNMPVNMSSAYKLIGQLYEQIEVSKEKVTIYDAIMHTDSTFTMKEVADVLSKSFKKKIGRNKLLAYLRTKEVIIKTGRTPSVKFLENKKGLFVVDMDEANGRSYAATKAYPKGIKFIYDLLKQDWDEDLETDLADGEMYIPKQFEKVPNVESLLA